MKNVELELANALNTSYDANEVHFVLEYFETLLENANEQHMNQLSESRINLNPD